VNATVNASVASPAAVSPAAASTAAAGPVARQPLAVLKAELFKALGHPIRVRVLELLAVADTPVSEMLADTGIEPSTLSTHLAVLRHGEKQPQHKYSRIQQRVIRRDQRVIDRAVIVRLQRKEE